MNKVRGAGAAAQFVWALGFLTVVSAGFFGVGALNNHSVAYWYLLWNLFLGWLPLVAVYALTKVWHRYGWTSWRGITLTLVWLGFLPNSFYMVSDFIHLEDVQRLNILFDAVMFTSFIFTSLLLGYTSLYIVHNELARRLKSATAWTWVVGLLALCSFAIYLGRDLRWNTWDVFVNPAGLLFDVSDQLLNPSAHYAAFTTTLTFFVFLTSVYIVVWRMTRALQRLH